MDNSHNHTTPAMEHPVIHLPRRRPPRRRAQPARIHPASLFTPQDASLSPEAHFPLQTVASPDRTPFPRFINRFDSREILLAVDSSCVNNGRHADPLRDPTGGCSFVFRGFAASLRHGDNDSINNYSNSDNNYSNSDNNYSNNLSITTNNNTQPPLPPPVGGSIAFRLERTGPSGHPAPATSNRAKLRAVLAALQFRAWGGEGWRRVVVRTDLAYVVWGATRWLPRWVARGWRKPGGRGGGCYGNRDLWEALQGRVEELRGMGCEVAFWLVPGVGDVAGGEGIVRRAKVAARGAAREGEAGEGFAKLLGVMV